MHELVLVVSDLYLPREQVDRNSSMGEHSGPQSPGSLALPGLQHVTRFATRSTLASGWRPWLARWLTGTEFGTAASVAAFASSRIHPQALTASRGSGAALGPSELPRSPASPPPAESPSVTVWMATPVHLVTGLSSLHLDRRSVLRLEAGEAAALAAEFGRVFHDSGFALEPLDSGDFLLFGPELPVTQELEPARFMGESVADAHQGRAIAPQLRRLSAEVEMWLHEHPINDARIRRTEPPITGLWLWGGGRIPAQRNSPPASPSEPSSDIAFGSDAYLQGLWATMGQKTRPVPQQLTEIFSYPEARRAVLVIDIGSMLHSSATWTLFDALAHIDRTFIAPAVEALGTRLDQLVVVANDRQLTLRRRDRFKLWRRTPMGLSGLQ